MYNNKIVILEEWGITTDAAEVYIENQFIYDLDAGKLNLHHEKM